MDAMLSEWLNLALRWLHIIAGIAWIGSSFFFNWLDSRLTAPERPTEGVEGELWMVHSGGFYQVQKILVAPEEMPRTLHWFKWEAAVTWISGILLLALIYYLGAEVYLVDRSVADIGAGAAIVIGLGTMAVAWVVYDLLWTSPLGRNTVAAGAISGLLAIAAAYGLSQVFGGRGAYMHVGAMLGTVMVANVWMRIIPAQKALVAATRAGTKPDATKAASAKQRSTHNNYMTLPVVFIMVSAHYPGTYGHAWNWAVLAVLALAGAAIRHCFNLRNNGRAAAGWWYAGGGTAAVVALMVATAPTSEPPDLAAADEPVAFAAVAAVIGQRCTPCHSASPSDENFDAPPNDLAFDAPAEIQAWADRIHARAVIDRTMPLGNSTGMTEEERALLGRWFYQGAAID